MADLVPLLVVLALVALNGLFVMAEFAVVGAPRVAIERRAGHGEPLARLARWVLRTRHGQDDYIATAQLGITGASLGLGMYGEEALAELLATALGLGPTGSHAVASVAAVALLTALHIVLGEMVPKALSLARAETTFLHVTPFMLCCFGLTAPLVLLLNTVGRGALRLLGGGEGGGAQQYHSAEELEMVVRESQESGLLEGSSGHMLRELFDFGDLTAGQVMVPRTRIVGLPVGATPDQVRAVLRADRHTRYPLHGEDLDEVVGVVHVKQLLAALLADRPVAAADAQPVPFVPETAPLDTVLEAMRRGASSMVIVMDEFGGTAGLVATDDLSAEIIGEVAAGIVGPADLRPQADGTTLVNGTARLDDLGELLRLGLTHEDVESVSGLVLMLLNRPPEVGDEVVFRGVTLRVLSVEGRGVAECRVSPTPAAEP